MAPRRALALLLLVSPSAGQSTTLLTETFDSGSGFTMTGSDGNTISAFFSDGYSDYLGINNGAGASCFSSACTDDPPSGAPAYTGFTGAYLEGEDLDGEGASIPITLTWPTVSGS